MGAVTMSLDSEFHTFNGDESPAITADTWGEAPSTLSDLPTNIEGFADENEEENLAMSEVVHETQVLAQDHLVIAVAVMLFVVFTWLCSKPRCQAKRSEVPARYACPEYGAV